MPNPRVGVGVIIRRASDGAFLVGRRKGSHGAGQLALPGGALEWRESVAHCASRETLEETGLVVDVSAWRAPFGIAEAVIDENNHWITVFAACEVADDAEVENREPHKCEGWFFVSKAELLEREANGEALFLPLKSLLRDDRVAW